MRFNKKVTTAALMLSLFALPALAESGKEGVGGDSIVCYDRPYYLDNGRVDTDAKITMAKFVDFQEQSLLSKHKIVAHNSEDTQNKIFRSTINKLESYDEVKARKLRTIESEMSFKEIDFSQNNLTRNLRLKELDDANLKFDLVGNCYVQQVAYQVVNPNEDEVNVLIDKRITPFFSEVEKSGLHLHEILWKYFLSINPDLEDSDSIRRFNFLLHSDKMYGMTGVDYIKMLETIIVDPQEKKSLKDVKDGSYVKLKVLRGANPLEIYIHGIDITAEAVYGESSYYSLDTFKSGTIAKTVKGRHHIIYIRMGFSILFMLVVKSLVELITEITPLGRPTPDCYQSLEDLRCGWIKTMSLHR